MIAQEEEDAAREAGLYGHRGNYIKRRAQLDPITRDNINYQKSVAVTKYVYQGPNGFYSEAELNPQHFRYNQTEAERNFGHIKI